MNFAAVLRRIGSRLELEEEPFALVGGLGLAAFGIARATLDLDLLVAARAQDMVIEQMGGLGYETLYRSTGYSNHLHPDESFGRVDFVYVSGDTEERIFAGATMMEGPDGMKVLVPRPEHLVAMKVLAFKNDPRRRLQDMADIARLLELETVDRQAVRDAFERYGMLRFWHEFEHGEDPD